MTLNESTVEDAALGWFQSNQSAYPTATVTKALSFDNVDLRHQIYTERVNVNTFRDGDKNTAVIDLDGTLIVDYEGSLYYPKNKQALIDKLFK